MTTHTTTDARPQPLDLSWLNLDDQYDTQATPSRRGLTLDGMNQAAFPPDAAQAGNHTMRLRGTAPREGAPRFGYAYVGKAESWSEAVPMLYEEAVQRQWSSATDIPWDTIEPLPDAVERAMCQFCTVPQRGGVHRRRRPRAVAAAALAGILRGRPVPDDADHGRGPPHGCLPQARADQRRRAAGSRGRARGCA